MKTDFGFVAKCANCDQIHLYFGNIIQSLDPQSLDQMIQVTSLLLKETPGCSPNCSKRNRAFKLTSEGTYFAFSYQELVSLQELLEMSSLIIETEKTITPIIWKF